LTNETVCNSAKLTLILSLISVYHNKSCEWRFTKCSTKETR